MTQPTTVTFLTKIISVISHTRSQLRWCNVSTHINLLTDNPFTGRLPLVIFKWHFSGCIMWGDSTKISFLSPAAAMFPYLEVCPWNWVIRPMRLPRWEGLLLDKSTTGTSHYSIHSLNHPAQRHNIAWQTLGCKIKLDVKLEMLSVRWPQQMNKQGVWLIRFSNSWFGTLSTRSILMRI